MILKDTCIYVLLNSFLLPLEEQRDGKIFRFPPNGENRKSIYLANYVLVLLTLNPVLLEVFFKINEFSAQNARQCRTSSKMIRTDNDIFCRGRRS